MEIVSEPDIRSPEEAGAYVRKLRSILRYLGTCDGNMEEGSLRADVNVSVRKHGEPYRTRCEIKNVNSVRFVMQAVEAEAARQIEVWESGGTVEQETRLFDAARGTTRSMRSKEDAHDYRYFPDPDLPPLVLDEAWVAEIEKKLPELPDAKRARFIEEYGLSRYQASILVADHETADHFEAAAPNAGNSTELANLMIGVIPAVANRGGFNLEDVFRERLSAGTTASVSAMIANLEINRQVAPRIIDVAIRTGLDAVSIVERNGWRQEKDTSAIDAAVATVSRCQRGQGRGISGRERKAVRLFRWSGDEGDGRPWQPGAGQRGGKGKAGGVRSAPTAVSG